MSETDAAPTAARSDEIDRLRRVAFGRTANDADEQAAAAALVELARIDAEIDAERTAARQAAEAEAERSNAELAEALRAEAPPAEAPLAELEDDPDRPRARWRRWLAPASVGLIAGAVIASGLAVAFPPTSTAPTAIPTSDSVTDNGASTNVNYFLGNPAGATEAEEDSTDGTLANSTAGGDVQAAEKWFADEQTDEDLVGVGSLLPEFDRGSVRLVHASAVARAWVAKRVDGQLCLEVTVSETDLTTGSCALPPDFTDRGLTVSTDPITVRFNGAQVSVLLNEPQVPATP